MPSVGPMLGGFRNVAGGYYIPTTGAAGVPSVVINVLTPGSGSGGSTAPPSFTALTGAATWAGMSLATSLSTLNAFDGGMLRDMGRTLVSSGRTFRKVQLVKNSLSTPTGQAPGTNPQQDYATGYLEVGVGAGAGATFNKVAFYPAMY